MNSVKLSMIRPHIRSLRPSFPSKHGNLVSKLSNAQFYRAPVSMTNLLSMKDLRIINQSQFYSSRRARRERREAATLEKEEQQAQTKEIVPQNEHEEFNRYEADMSDATGQELITGNVAKHLVKVYKTLLATTGVATLGVITPLLIPPLFALAPLGFVASLGGVLGISFTSPEKLTLRQNLLLLVGLGNGLMIAPLVASSAFLGPVVLATAGTAAIFAGFTLAALRAKTSSVLKFGGVLYGGLFLVFGITIAMILLPMLGVALSPAVMAAMHNVWLYVGLAIFSGLIAYDTSAMIERARSGIEDHISDALGLFLNLANIFVRLLYIFGNND